MKISILGIDQDYEVSYDRLQLWMSSFYREGHLYDVAVQYQEIYDGFPSPKAFSTRKREL